MIELRQIAKLFLRLTVAASMLRQLPTASVYGPKMYVCGAICNKFCCLYSIVNTLYTCKCYSCIGLDSHYIRDFIVYLSTYRAKVKVVCIAHRTNDSYLCYCNGNVYGL